MCKHNKEITDVWKTAKTKKEATGALQSQIKEETLTESYVEGLVTKKEQAEFDQDFLKDPKSRAEEIIQKGTAVLDRHGNPEQYGIIISADLERHVGIHYKKEKKKAYVEKDDSSIHTTRAFISFNIDDVIEQMSKDGIKSWEGKNLGSITTMCPERSQKK